MSGVDAAQPVEMTDDILIDTGDGRPITWAELNANRHRDRSEDYLRQLRAVMRAKRDEQFRVADMIEQAMYAAKSEETMNVLRELAHKVLA